MMSTWHGNKSYFLTAGHQLMELFPHAIKETLPTKLSGLLKSASSLAQEVFESMLLHSHQLTLVSQRRPALEKFLQSLHQTREVFLSWEVQHFLGTVERLEQWSSLSPAESPPVDETGSISAFPNAPSLQSGVLLIRIQDLLLSQGIALGFKAPIVEVVLGQPCTLANQIPYRKRTFELKDASSTIVRTATTISLYVPHYC